MTLESDPSGAVNDRHMVSAKACSVPGAPKAATRANTPTGRTPPPSSSLSSSLAPPLPSSPPPPPPPPRQAACSNSSPTRSSTRRACACRTSAAPRLDAVAASAAPTRCLSTAIATKPPARCIRSCVRTWGGGARFLLKYRDSYHGLGRRHLHGPTREGRVELGTPRLRSAAQAQGRQGAKAKRAAAKHTTGACFASPTSTRGCCAVT